MNPNACNVLTVRAERERERERKREKEREKEEDGNSNMSLKVSSRLCKLISKYTSISSE